MRRLNHAQSTLEYAIIIGAVIGGLMLMQTYVRRAIQGQLRSGADSIGDQYSAIDGTQTSYYERNLTGNEATTEAQYTSDTEEHVYRQDDSSVPLFRRETP